MRILTKQQVFEIFDMKEAVAYTEKAFALYSDGKANSPVRTQLNTPSGCNFFMPASTDESCGCKVVNTRFNNGKKGLPTILAVYVDIDEETGQISTLLDGQALTYFRTGAASGVAAKYLSREDAKVLIIIGTGVQGTAGCEAVLAVRDIKKVIAFDGYKPSLERFEAKIKEKGIECETHLIADVNKYIHEADIIVTTTTSKEPVFDSKNVKKGTFISCVGAFQPTTREIDTNLVQKAKVYVDTKEGCFKEAGDLLIPVQEGKFKLEDVKGEIGEVVNKKVEGRKNKNEIIVFKTVGSSIQDTVVGHQISLLAASKNVGTIIDM